MMMIVIIMMIASYTNDDDRHHHALTIYDATNFLTDGRTNKVILGVGLVNRFNTIQLENLSKGLKDGPCSVIKSGRQTADVYLPPMTNGCKWVKGGSALILNPHALSFGIQW